MADVPVALVNVNACRVEEPLRRRLERLVSPPVAVRVPVKLAAEDMFCELMRPAETTFANKFVVDALFEM